MQHLRPFGLLSAAVLLVACTGGVQPTTPPSSAGASSAPTPAPPSASLDPSLSDAGIVARVTITNDTSGGRDGTHDIAGVDGDASECSGSFEEPNYLVVAWYDDAPIGQMHRFSVGVLAADIPEGDGSTTDIEHGGVSFSFKSESGLGGQYTGNATRENEGSVTIDVTRAGTSLAFDFEGVTNAGVNFSGQLLCAET